MNKNEVMLKLNKKVVAVIRVKDFSLAEKISESIIENGIEVIEVTYSVESAGKLINNLKRKYPDKLIGAGTVLKLSDAQEAIDNGSDFVVSPCIVEEVCKLCLDNDVLCSLGVATPSEAYKAYKLGSDIVKLFPGSSFKPSYIKDLKEPLPFIEFMTTGGVNESNIKEWFECGATAVGLGGYFTKGIDESNLTELSLRVKKILNAVK